MLWQEPYSLSSCTPLYTIRTRPSSRHVARYGSLGGSNSYYQNIYKAHIPLYNIYECIRAPHYEVLFSLITKVYHATRSESVSSLFLVVGHNRHNLNRSFAAIIYQSLSIWIPFFIILYFQFSSSPAASFNSFRISICCGQCFSHFPHEIHWEALLVSFRNAVHCK